MSLSDSQLLLLKDLIRADQAYRNQDKNELYVLDRRVEVGRFTRHKYVTAQSLIEMGLADFNPTDQIYQTHISLVDFTYED